MFGCVVPGRPCIANFKQIGQNKWLTSIENSNQNSALEIVLFMLPNAPPIPQNAGCSIYLSTNMQNWEYSGCLLPSQPSTIIHVPIHFEPQQSNAALFQQGSPPRSQQVPPNQIFIGINLEPQEQIKNISGKEVLQKQNYGNQVMTLTKYIAQDLFRFMESFAKSAGSHNEFIVIPSNVLDKWLTKFTNKIKLDPYFWKKQQK